MTIAATLLGAGTGGAWTLLNPRTHDPYLFLNEHPLLAVGVLGPGTWGPAELRMYSWKERWEQVAKRAGPDLGRFGLVRRQLGKGAAPAAQWTERELYGNGLEGMHSDLMVYIVPGRCASLHAVKPMTDDDPQWTTVIVSSTLEETWVNVVRYTCFPMPD